LGLAENCPELVWRERAFREDSIQLLDAEGHAAAAGRDCRCVLRSGRRHAVAKQTLVVRDVVTADSKGLVALLAGQPNYSR